MDANSGDPHQQRQQPETDNNSNSSQRRPVRRRRRTRNGAQIGNSRASAGSSTSNSSETTAGETTDPTRGPNAPTINATANNLQPECNISTSSQVAPITEPPNSHQQSEIEADEGPAKNDNEHDEGGDDEQIAAYSFSPSSINQQVSSSPSTQSISEPSTPSVNAVRVLFMDQQLQRQRFNQTSHSTISSQSIPSIVGASRRLIERQIEAIQVADSQRWNFDFRNCQPLAQSGHRYVHHHYPVPSTRNCRPLHDQNQSGATRFNNQQQWPSSASQGNYRQHSGDHKKDGG